MKLCFRRSRIWPVVVTAYVTGAMMIIPSWSFAQDSTRAASGNTTIALQVKVTDDTGKPVAGAQACGIALEPKSSYVPKINWRSARDGVVTLTADDVCSAGLGEQPLGRFKIVVRAKGFAPKIAKIDLPTTNGQAASVQLNRGRRVELLLRSASGKSIPDDLEPSTCDAALSQHAMMGLARGGYSGGWYGSDPVPSGSPVNLTLMENLGKGRYAFQVADDTPPLYLLVDHLSLIHI